MSSPRWLVLCAALGFAACHGNNGNEAPKFQCADGKDNDGDGLTDFPDDPGCTGPEDNSEDSAAAPQCSDGRDNDGDGKIDYPNDPGCFAPQQDAEDDDCPDGPNCPECGNGKDDDHNGHMDYPDDTGCSAASDIDEFTENPVACGENVMIKKLPFDNVVNGSFTAGSTSKLTSMMCGGAGMEDVYELRLKAPKVVVASTDNALTQADTVLYVRSTDCSNPTAEMACNDDVSAMDTKSSITVALDPGVYYLIVDSHDASTAGAYHLDVHFYVGEGVECQTGDDCGPGLVCRIPLGGSTKVCSKHVCSDGVDDDADGKNDYPEDPGCDSPTDDDEMDDCPNGPMCPECGDHRDNDGDGKTDYPADTQCQAASSTSEACVSHEAVQQVTTAMTMGDTTGMTSDFDPTCASTGAADLTYRIDVPALQQLDLSLTATYSYAFAVYNASCGGTALACNSGFGTQTLTNLAAGTYYVDVDGYFAGDEGSFTLNVAGKINNGASCESALAKSGALTCGTGYACKGTMGSRTCQAAACSDGADNDGDGKKDYPNDPGCDSPGDDTEADPTTPPVCANMMDDDTDGATDWPADYGCAAASGTSEVFCMPEHDPTSKITTKVTTGDTTGKSADTVPSCSSFSTASDVTYGLQLPVPVVSLQVDTLGTSYDTVLTMRDVTCATELACDDDFMGSLQSGFVLSNVAAGGYAIVVDGYSSSAGPFTLNVHGTVANGTDCSSALFTGGAAAVLSCPTGKTCTGTPKRCQ